MTIRPPNRIVPKALFGLTTRIIKLRVKFSNITRKIPTPLSSIKLSIFNKAGIFILLSLVVIPSKTYAEKINSEKFFNSKIGREVEVVEGEIIVRFKPRSEAGAIRKMNEAFGSQLRKEIKSMNIHRIRLGKGKKIGDMLEMYRKDPNVLFAEPNYIARVLAITPNDPSFSQQWGLSKIYAPEAWDIEKGNSNGIIAIVDTGIDLDHPDLDEKIVPGYDFVNEDSGPMDDNGHGTHCAGIAAAESNNGQGITGVAWGSKLMPVKVLDSDGTGTYSDVAEGIIYAADKGAKVINLSLGAYSYSQTLQDAVDYAYQKGCVIVAAAGNDNTDEPLYPAACGNVIGVAATDQNDARWAFSNYGDYIDVCAPGVNIYSTFLDNVYISASGTSASAPFVSGLVALLLSQDSSLTNYEVENKIKQSADDLGTTGRDGYFGHGRINLYRCIEGLITNPPFSIHDLAITNVTAIPIDIFPGDKVIVNITVENKGSADENDIPLNLIIETLNINMKKSIPRLASGESIVCKFQWVTPDIQISPDMLVPIFRLDCQVGDISKETEETRFDNRRSIFAVFNKPTGKLEIKHKIKESKEVHQWIAKEAYDYFVSQFSGSEIGTYLGTISGSHNDNDNNILEGTKDEDVAGENPFGQDGEIILVGVIPMINHPSGRHLCMGADGSELYDGYGVVKVDDSDGYYSNYEQAYNYLNTYLVDKYSTNKSKAYYYLGHVAHLLADLCVPAHTHNDAHGEYGIFVGSGEDEYEGTIAYSDNYKLWGYPNPIRRGPSGDVELFTSFYDLFQQTCDYTEEYPSDDNNGDDETGIPNTGFHRPHLVSRSGGIDINEITIMGDDLMPFAMKRLAALYRYFYRRVDSTPPSVSITYPTSSNVTSPDYKNTLNFTITASASDSVSGVNIDSYRFKYCYWTGTAWTSWYDISPSPTTSSVNFSGVNGRLYGFYVSVENGGGREGTSSVKYLKVDTSGDNIVALSARTYSGGSSISETTWQTDDDPYFYWNQPVSASPIVGYSYSLDSTPDNTVDTTETYYQYPSNFIGNGKHTFYVKAKDAAGNWGNYKSFNIWVDDSIPDVGSVSCWKEDSHYTSISANTWQNDGVVSFTWSDPNSVSADTYYFEYNTISGNTISGNESSTINEYVNNYPLTQGTRYFHVRPINGVGTWGPERIFRILYDGTAPNAPSISESHCGSYWTTHNSPYFTWSNPGDVGGSEVSRYEGSKDGGVAYNVLSGYHPFWSDGTHTFSVRAIDAAGNPSSWSNSITVKIDTTQPSNPTTCSETNGAQDGTWQSGVDNPNFTWSGASDGNGSGINGYYYYWGTDSGGTSLNYKTSSGYDPPSVNDGIYYLRVKTKDNVNLTANDWVMLFTFMYDGTAPAKPTVTSSTHKENEWNTISDDPIFKWSVPSDLSGIDGFSFELNHTQNYVPDTVKDCEETTTSKQYIDVADGIWYFHIRARDNAGNWGATDTYGPVKIDLTAPTFSAISPSADPAKEGDITITVIASEQMSVLSASVTQKDKDSALINMKSDDGVTWTCIYTVVSGYEGMATIGVSGKDLAGKEGSDLTSFVVDTIPPTKAQIYSTTHPKNIPTSNGNPSFTWTDSTDPGGSGVAGYSYAVSEVESYDLDVATETTGTSASFTRQDGIWWFHLRGVDKAGNGSEIDRYKFIIDTTSPTFTASSSKDPAKEGDVTITVQASEELKEPPTVNVKQKDQVSVKKVEVSSKDNITWTGSYPVVLEHDGTAIINVSGVDLANNTGSGSGTFEVDNIPPTASIGILLTTPLKTGEFQIELTIKDASNIPQKPSLSYTPLGGSLISVPLTGSDKSWSGTSYIESTTPDGTAEFSFSAVDAAGNLGRTITSGEMFEIETAIDVTEGGTSSNSDGTKVEVPKNAVSEDINVRITVPDPNLSIIREADNNLVDDKGINPIKTTNLYRSIIAIGESDAEIKRFDKPIAISIPYPDGDQNGIVDKTNIREASLRMFYLDENQTKWLLVPDFQVDPDGNNVTARVSHFSIYTIMQLSPASSLSEVFGYPNPCYVKRDGYVRISNIPLDAKQVKIYIYNVVGELIRTLEEGDGIEELAGSKIGKWDGRNENDEMVASGIYVYLIKSRGTKKTEKIAIFW